MFHVKHLLRKFLDDFTFKSIQLEMSCEYYVKGKLAAQYSVDGETWVGQYQENGTSGMTQRYSELFRWCDAVLNPDNGPVRYIRIISGAEQYLGDIERSKAKLIYTTPCHQFPVGFCMDMQTRALLLLKADEKDAFIIEDNYIVNHFKRCQ